MMRFVTLPFNIPQFFVTAPAPCPYLPGRAERKVFTDLAGDDPEHMSEALGRIGFRRSQTVAYRPSCQGCNACVSVRIVARDFTPNATQRRTMRRNADLTVRACRPWATSEQHDLLSRYLERRHPDGGMAGMESEDFAAMLERTPVDTVVMEYRAPDGQLVGACITDRQQDGLSMVYSFFDTEARPGLGTHIIVDHALQARAAGLPYVYLGYWVEGSPQMAYKARFRPLEQLTASGWQPLVMAEAGAARLLETIR